MHVKKIVYLFGAGATQAELFNSADNPDATFRNKFGLLISDVSCRVMKNAHRRSWFKQQAEILASKSGNFNIELYISLLESNNFPEKEIQALKDLVRYDIENILTKERKSRFYLHKALLELHKRIKGHEELIGFISVNYDEVLDEAYSALYNVEPEYCLTSKYKKNLPLLKLHGSFSWKDIEIYELRETIPIIPLGINKNYLIPPYNFIWGRAYELLTQCDILRIVGCSMNQNDIGLIDLLFKAHKQRRACFEIQIIDFQPADGHHQIRNNYGFFPKIVDPIDIEESLISDPLIKDYNIGNPFKIWLKAKALKMIEDYIPRTKYLKSCL